MSKDFEKAQQRLKSLKEDPGNNAKLKLYGLFKQATVGKCNVSKPGITDFVGRAKWNSWNELKNMPKDEAEKKYIEYVNQLLGDKTNESSSPSIKEYTEIKVSIEYETMFKIQLNRPEKLNALTEKSYSEIIDALKEADQNENVLFCCVTGSGKFFSSGNDLSNYLKQSDEDSSVLIKKGVDLVENFINSFINFSKPLVALVNGPSVGISFTVLGLFDLVIASDTATFHAPFTKLALSPEGCSSYTFPLLMGKNKAQEILLFNRKLTAQEAYERNLVTKVIPSQDFEKETNKEMEIISKLPRNSFIESRNLMRESHREQLLKVSRQEKELLLRRFLTGEFFESVMAFMSKKSKL